MEIKSALRAVSAAFAIALAAPGAASERGETVAPHFERVIPNIPGKSLVAVVVDYAPGGASLPHTHAKSAFVFAYVLPKIGSGFGTGAAGASGLTFATILVPGLMGSMFLMQGMFGTTMPLVMEFSWQRTIEDRALAPVPIRVLAIQKITAGAIQAFIGAAIVFPVVFWVHAPGQGPHIEVTSWFLLAAVMVFSSTLTASMGLWLGTVVDPRKMQMVFAVVLLPLTMLGCVYYPWSALHVIRWLQILVLINPMVYMTEGLRAALTPSIGHMPLWAIMLALVGGTAVFGYLGVRTFRNRVVN